MVDDTTRGGSHDIEVTGDAATWPVHFVPSDKKQPPEPGTSGLCLSGGGSRAMLFHVGALRRLNELGLLARLDRVSSVSGGSIVSGLLGIHWKDLNFVDDVATNFETQARRADHGVRVGPGGRPGGHQGRPPARRHGRIDLHEDPAGPPLRRRDAAGAAHRRRRSAVRHQRDEPPVGVLFRFSRPYVADWKLGIYEGADFPIAVAVAASAAFPPFFSPVRLDIPDGKFTPGSGDAKAGIGTPEFQRRILLADGGVYDNLGLETVFKRAATRSMRATVAAA